MVNPYVLAVAPGCGGRPKPMGGTFWRSTTSRAAMPTTHPGLNDLPKVVDVMSALGRIPCPDLPLKQAEQRWADYVHDDSALSLLRGDSLLHTDFNPLSILISSEDKHIVDWAWPTRGAAWIDPACFVLRLMAAGHTPAGAESWAARTAAWTTVPTEGITMFAEASRRMWEQIAQSDPQPWKKQLARVARHWADYRFSLLAD